MTWYVRDGLKPRGPFEKNEIEHRLKKGELSPEDWVCRGSVNDWKPAREFVEFSRVAFPCEQQVELHDATVPVWVVLSIQGGQPLQHGPVSLAQVREGLLKGRFRLQDHLWCEGMTGWARIASRPEFRDLRRLISPDL